MKTQFKLIVLAFLQTLPESPFDQFNQAFEIYKNLPNKSAVAEASFNRRGYSEQSLNNLLYDLKKLCDISDVEVLNIQTAEILEKDVKIARFMEILGESIVNSNSAILGFLKVIHDYGVEAISENAEIMEYYNKENEALSLLSNQDSEFAGEEFGNLALEFYSEKIKDYVLPDDVTTILESSEKKVLKLVPDPQDTFIDELNENTISEKQTVEVETKALRYEFPFLNDKDCPDVLFVVVGRRIAAHKQYVELHAKLQEANAGTVILSAEEMLDLTSSCEAAFNENQKLWDELNYYNEKKEILGKHPLFRESNLQKEVDLMTTDDMFKFKTSSTKYFHDQKKALIKYADNPEKIEEVNSRIADREFKLALINARIGSADGEAKK